MNDAEHVGHAGSGWNRVPISGGKAWAVVVSYPEIPGDRWLMIGAIESPEGGSYPLDRFETLAASQWEVGPDRFHSIMRKICRTFGFSLELLTEDGPRMLHLEVVQSIDSSPTIRRLIEALTEEAVVELAQILTGPAFAAAKATSLQIQAPNN